MNLAALFYAPTGVGLESSRKDGVSQRPLFLPIFLPILAPFARWPIFWAIVPAGGHKFSVEEGRFDVRMVWYWSHGVSKVDLSRWTSLESTNTF